MAAQATQINMGQQWHGPQTLRCSQVTEQILVILTALGGVMNINSNPVYHRAVEPDMSLSSCSGPEIPRLQVGVQATPISVVLTEA